jgi:hypothetical protein
VATGTFYPASTADDGGLLVTTGNFSTGAVHIGHDYLYTGEFFIRFPNVTIPINATITEAYVRFYAYESSLDVDALCYFNAEDDAVAPTAEFQFNGLDLTSNSVVWEIRDSWTALNQYNTPDLTTPLQEVVDRGGWASGNAVMIVVKNNGTTGNNYRIIYDYGSSGAAYKAELHVTYTRNEDETTAECKTFTLSEKPSSIEYDSNILANTSNLSITSFGSTVDLNVYVSATYQSLTIAGQSSEISHDENISALYATLTVSGRQSLVGLSGDISAACVLLGVTTYSTEISFDVEINAECKAFTLNVFTQDVEAVISVNATHVELTLTAYNAGVWSTYNLDLTETFMIYETLGWGWVKSLESTAGISDVVEIELGLILNESLAVKETLTNNWTGTESITSTLSMFGNAMIAQVFSDEITSTMNAVEIISFLHNMNSVANSTMNAAETLSLGVEFNPTVIESLAVTGLLSVFKTINQSISESVEITESQSITWPKIIFDGANIADASTLQWIAMHVLTESLVATETAIGLFNFSDTVSETLNIAATLALQQILQESVEDILNFGITIKLDDELWECWVLNTNAFHVSVYSGFDFNSYAVYNNQAFGCREDGIYRLDGETDNGDTINAGIVLPETDFGTSRNKRFRKAYFGISGSSPSIKLEDELYGSKVYTITDSKTTISRVQKGKKWTLKLQGFDDLDFIELVPIILTR